MSAISLHILIYSCLIKQSKFLRGKLYRKSLCPHTSLHVNVGVVLFCCLLAFKVFIIFVYSLCVYVERPENNLWSQASLSSMQFLVLKHRLWGFRARVFITEPSCRPLVVCFLWERSHTTLYPRLVLNQGKLSDSASQVLGLQAFMNYHTRGNLLLSPG